MKQQARNSSSFPSQTCWIQETFIKKISLASGFNYFCLPLIVSNGSYVYKNLLLIQV